MLPLQMQESLRVELDPHKQMILKAHYDQLCRSK